MSVIPDDLFPERRESSVLQHLYSDDVDGDTVAFWKRAIVTRCIVSESIVFNHDDITRDFTVQGLYPASYTLVVEQQKLSEHVIPVHTLQEQTTTVFPMLTFFSGLLYSGGSGSCDEYVCTEVLDHIDKQLVAYAGSRVEDDRVHLFDLSDTEGTLREYLAGVPLEGSGTAGSIMKLFRALVDPDGQSIKTSELMLLLRYMQRKGTVVVSPENTLIKFLGPLDVPQAVPSSSWGVVGSLVGLVLGGPPSFPLRINEKEECSVRLRRSRKVLGARVAELEDSMQAYREEAKAYLRKGDEHMKLLKMKSFLRARKDRNAAATALMTLEGLLQNIRTAEDQVIMLEAYKIAALALRTARTLTNGDGGVSEVTAHSIDDAVDAFQDEVDLGAEMTSSLERAAEHSGWSLECLSAEELAELESEYDALDHTTAAEGRSDDTSVGMLTTQLARDLQVGKDEDGMITCVVPPPGLPEAPSNEALLHKHDGTGLAASQPVAL